MLYRKQDWVNKGGEMAKKRRQYEQVSSSSLNSNNSYYCVLDNMARCSTIHQKLPLKWLADVKAFIPKKKARFTIQGMALAGLVTDAESGRCLGRGYGTKIVLLPRNLNTLLREIGSIHYGEENGKQIVTVKCKSSVVNWVGNITSTNKFHVDGLSQVTITGECSINIGD